MPEVDAPNAAVEAKRSRRRRRRGPSSVVTVGPDAQISQLVAGNVYTTQLLFQIGDKLHSINELSPDDIERLLKRSIGTRHDARSVALTQSLIWTALMGAFSLAVFSAARHADDRHIAYLFGTVSVLGGFLWWYLDVFLGSSRRIHKRLMAELEQREVLLKVELALKTEPQRRTLRHRLKAWLDGIRH